MTPEQLQIFLEDNRKSTGAAIEKYVNGNLRALDQKIEEHNRVHNEDMKRILPVVEAYEDAVRGGKRVLWSAGSIMTVGGAYLIIRQIFRI